MVTGPGLLQAYVVVTRRELMGARKRLVVSDGCQVFARGQLLGPGEHFLADNDWARQLISSGLAKLAPVPKNKMQRATRNKGTRP
jgi:hypothetical protein